MITLTRFSGQRFALNSDLIERIEATPDTVISMTDGTKYVVVENLDEVIDAVLTFRARLVALSGRLTETAEDQPGGRTQVAATAGRSRLAAVHPLKGSPNEQATSDEQEGEI